MTFRAKVALACCFLSLLAYEMHGGYLPHCSCAADREVNMQAASAVGETEDLPSSCAKLTCSLLPLSFCRLPPTLPTSDACTPPSALAAVCKCVQTKDRLSRINAGSCPTSFLVRLLLLLLLLLLLFQMAGLTPAQEAVIAAINTCATLTAPQQAAARERIFSDAGLALRMQPPLVPAHQLQDQLVATFGSAAGQPVHGRSLRGARCPTIAHLALTCHSLSVLSLCALLFFIRAVCAPHRFRRVSCRRYAASLSARISCLRACGGYAGLAAVTHSCSICALSMLLILSLSLSLSLSLLFDMRLWSMNIHTKRCWLHLCSAEAASARRGEMQSASWSDMLMAD
jgi:hypothetical protein